MWERFDSWYSKTSPFRETSALNKIRGYIMIVIRVQQCLVLHQTRLLHLWNRLPSNQLDCMLSLVQNRYLFENMDEAWYGRWEESMCVYGVVGHKGNNKDGNKKGCTKNKKFSRHIQETNIIMLTSGFHMFSSPHIGQVIADKSEAATSENRQGNCCCNLFPVKGW